MLVARRGLGPDEIALIEPPFMAAVRWALFAEKYSADLGDLRSAVAARADSLSGQDLIDFTTGQRRYREELRMREATLFPKDDPDVD